MKYLILIHHNQTVRETWESFSEAERADGWKRVIGLLDELAESGELVLSEGLGDPSLTRSVSVRDGETTVDGPFPEAKEYLAGFHIVDVESEERALEIAARVPEA